MVLAVALAHIEASVVVYLREALVDARAVFPDHLREPVPLLSKQQLQAASGNVPSLLGLELVRELTALAVLAAAAVGFSRRRGEFGGMFLVGFGLWDIFYYVFLKAQIGWPASLATWDVLFLIPVPWLAPVWAPLLVATTLTIAGLATLARPVRRMSARSRLGCWIVILSGACLILVSFCWRWRQGIGRMPARFDWPWFMAGWILMVVGMVWMLSRPSRPRL